MIQSKALEINIASSQIDVTINPEYMILQEIMSGYYGLAERLETFLQELSHPYRNWQFIVKEARSYSLDYFYLMKGHPKGPDTAGLFVTIFVDAIQSASQIEVKTDAADNLLLFLQKIIKESGKQIDRFSTELERAFKQIETLPGEYFFLFLKSYYSIKKLAETLADAADHSKTEFYQINSLLVKYYRKTFDYWLKEADPQKWFEAELDGPVKEMKTADLFSNISHGFIHRFDEKLNEICRRKKISSPDTTALLLELPGYDHFVKGYRNVPRKLYDVGKVIERGNRWKLIFAFHIMNVSGLSTIHEETLREINRTLSWLIAHEEERIVQQLVSKTFSLLKETSGRFPATALNCLSNMGRAIYKTDDSELIDYFVDSVIDLGFQTPMIGGVGNDWQIKVNSAHIQNIRTWLEIIELNPKWSTRLISALIIHLSLCGVFIKDTDLFPRDITHLLNSDITPVYNLIKQLARLFPVYFNDIGAEGDLREISTQIDEISYRKDVLIHFLRKQSHVESSNRIILFMQATLEFWKTKKKNGLQTFLPPVIYRQVQTGGEYIDGVHRAVTHLIEKGLAVPDDLLDISEDRLKELLGDVANVSEKDFERVNLAAKFYKLLNQKYNLSFLELEHYLARLEAEAFPDIKVLRDALKKSNVKARISSLLDYLERLSTIILSPESFEIREDIYKKRHFAVDIPSMYGSYHENKFDALGLMFRIESVVNVLLEELIDSIDLSLITKAAFSEIHDCLRLFNRALEVDGISSSEMERQLEFLSHSLNVRGFTFTQYLDIFKGFALSVKNIINDYFNNIHELNLDRILTALPFDQIQEKYLPRQRKVDHERLQHRVSEIFFRERIAFSLGLQQLDLFLSRILNTLFQQSSKLKKDNLQRLLFYDHQNAVFSMDRLDQGMSDIIHLGNKGHNMVKLKQFDLPVPPGFIITTEVFKSRKVLDNYPPAEQNLKEQIVREIHALEKTTGKAFGNPRNPLLLSVRSGSAISQPGMMDTFLDVGMNEDIAAGIAVQTGNAWFAWDNYRRFMQCYGMSYGLERDDFDAIINAFKQKWGIEYKRNFTGEQMKQTALAYKKRMTDSGIDIVESPYDQLFLIIKKVFDSWESDKALAYRKIMGISEDWGTAVTVQSMVYGNLSKKSGTGVIFTHNPRWSGDIPRLWGDFTLENQGEDVVSGLVNTLPISIYQQDFEMRDTDITLETHFPEIYETLKKWALFLIYDEGWGPQEMEFTFESPAVDGLYLLQTRDMAIRERKKVLTFDMDRVSQNRMLSHGIGVSGGALSGRIVFDLEEINKWRELEPEMTLVLVRNDTVPDDIREIFAADGLLTARGGLTSHAAVVAHRLGKTCVVGCGNLVCDEKQKKCFFHNAELKAGDFISIDGQQGSVYRGHLKVKET